MADIEPGRVSSRDVRVQRTKNGWVQVVTEYGVVDSYRGIDARDRAAARAVALGRVAHILDLHLPLRGPCGLCGSGMDQTHRVVDSIAGMARAEREDAGPWIAEEFGYPGGGQELVDACLAWSRS